MAVVGLAAAGLVLPTSPAAGTASLPRMVPGLVHVAEGDGGTTLVEVPVALSAPSSDTVTATWSTIHGPGVSPPNPATPGSDFTAASGTVSFAPGQTAQTVTIVAQGDALPEADEYIVIALGAPTNAVIGGFFGLGFGILDNDDAPPVLIPGAVRVREGNAGKTRVAIPVTLSKPSGLRVTSGWCTAVPPGVPNMARATNVDDPSLGADYFEDCGQVSFAPGETSTSLVIEAYGDTTHEEDEYIVVQFSPPTNATPGGYWGLGFGVLENDDAVPTSRTITVTPAGAHLGGDDVVVNGAGWTPNATIGICQAADDPSVPTPESACFAGTNTRLTIVADSAGEFAVPWSLYRFGYVSGLDSWIDCAASGNPCVMGAAEMDDVVGTVTKSVPMPWGVPSPPLQRGQIVVSPSTDLVDGSAISVSGTGFRSDYNLGRVIDVYQCVIEPTLDGPIGCDWDTRDRLHLDDPGAFSSVFTVSTSVLGYDCAVQQCYVAAAESSDFPRTVAYQPITFAAPPPP